MTISGQWTMLSFWWLMKLLMLMLLLFSAISVNAMMLKSGIGIAGYHPKYDDNNEQRQFMTLTTTTTTDEIIFGNHYASPTCIQQLLEEYLFSVSSSNKTKSIEYDHKKKKKKKTLRKRKYKFQWYQGKDGRHGYVRSIPLGNDWVLAESKQIVTGCTSSETILKTYLNGTLQRIWNPTQVQDCTITLVRESEEKEIGIKDEKKMTTTTNGIIPSYYHQDLILHSQRVLRGHTGPMKYRQKICIYKIGQNGHYTVSVTMDNNNNKNDATKQTTSTRKKPFEQLYVYVNLQPDTTKSNCFQIYAAGLMKVNRQVIPNLLIFDASGIAGNMAGKGTLWLVAYFDQQQRKRQKEEKKVVQEIMNHQMDASSQIPQQSTHTGWFQRPFRRRRNYQQHQSGLVVQ